MVLLGMSHRTTDVIKLPVINSYNRIPDCQFVTCSDV